MDTSTIKIPLGVIAHRERTCPKCLCGTDKTHPCTSCPKGLWTRFVLCEAPLPGIFQQGVNFIKAIFSEIRARLQGKPRVTQVGVRQRKKICLACPWFRLSDKRCGRCGCFIENKIAWRTQKCPDGKWNITKNN